MTDDEPSNRAHFACAGIDPQLFDFRASLTAELMLTIAEIGLSHCHGCTAKLACLELVDPISGFNGVAGGIVWRGGKQITSGDGRYARRPVVREGHGTNARYAYGCRCPLCAQAHSNRTKAYRARRMVEAS